MRRFLNRGAAILLAMIMIASAVDANTVLHADMTYMSEEQTTEIIESDNVEVEGYQLSINAPGLRTVYAVKTSIDGKEVVERGLIYALDDYVEDSDLYYNSTERTVYTFQATELGKSEQRFKEDKSYDDYIMTMKFADLSPEEIVRTVVVRAYAKLSDGSIQYSKVGHYDIFSIADNLYTKRKMNKREEHEYLYNNILKIIDPDYVEVEFDWGVDIVPPAPGL